MKVLERCWSYVRSWGTRVLSLQRKLFVFIIFPLLISSSSFIISLMPYQPYRPCWLISVSVLFLDFSCIFAFFLLWILTTDRGSVEALVEYFEENLPELLNPFAEPETPVIPAEPVSPLTLAQPESPVTPAEPNSPGVVDPGHLLPHHHSSFWDLFLCFIGYNDYPRFGSNALLFYIWFLRTFILRVVILCCAIPFWWNQYESSRQNMALILIYGLIWAAGHSLYLSMIPTALTIVKQRLVPLREQMEQIQRPLGHDNYTIEQTSHARVLMTNLTAFLVELEDSRTMRELRLSWAIFLILVVVAFPLLLFYFTWMLLRLEKGEFQVTFIFIAALLGFQVTTFMVLAFAATVTSEFHKLSQAFLKFWHEPDILSTAQHIIEHEGVKVYGITISYSVAMKTLVPIAGSLISYYVTRVLSDETDSSTH